MSIFHKLSLCFCVALTLLLCACTGKYFDFPHNARGDRQVADLQLAEIDRRGQAFWALEHEYDGINYHDFRVCMDPDGPLHVYLRMNNYDEADWRTDPADNDGACLVCTARRDLLPVALAKSKDDTRYKMSVIAAILHKNRKHNTDFRVIPTEFDGQPAVEFFVRSVPPNKPPLRGHGFISAVPDQVGTFLEVMYLMTENSSVKEEMNELGESFLKSVKFR